MYVYVNDLSVQRINRLPFTPRRPCVPNKPNKTPTPNQQNETKQKRREESPFSVRPES